MNTIQGVSQSLDPGAEIILFVLDLSRFKEPNIYFHAGTTWTGGDVVWQGVVYQRYPVSATGFEMKGQGPLPRPRFAVSNLTGIISALCRLYGDLVGARVARRRTLLRYLDAVNFPDGVNPDADPDAYFPDDLFFINQKTHEDPQTVEFELATAFDTEGQQLPRRQIIRNSCPWQYRGDGCGYAGGPVADGNDNPTSDPNQDVCGKRLTSCKMRFGASGWLPFGSFPGASAYR
jgi:lambda family phage minor tail protein L